MIEDSLPIRQQCLAGLRNRFNCLNVLLHVVLMVSKFRLPTPSLLRSDCGRSGQNPQPGPGWPQRPESTRRGVSWRFGAQVPFPAPHRLEGFGSGAGWEPANPRHKYIYIYIYIHIYIYIYWNSIGFRLRLDLVWFWFGSIWIGLDVALILLDFGSISAWFRLGFGWISIWFRLDFALVFILSITFTTIFV